MANLAPTIVTCQSVLYPTSYKLFQISFSLRVDNKQDFFSEGLAWNRTIENMCCPGK